MTRAVTEHFTQLIAMRVDENRLVIWYDPEQGTARWQRNLRFLRLRDSEVVVRYRQTFFELYRDRKLTIEGLEEVAPLIATAKKRPCEWN